MQPPTNNTQTPKKHPLRGLFFLVLWIIALGLIAAHRQDIIDWGKLRKYQAPAAVSQLATEDTMTSFARKVFYVNAPEIQDKTNFSKSCLAADSKHEQTIVLGCYHSDQDGIFLMKVTDPRLNGVEQVTAAHEMLHGAYDRLSGSDKTKVNAMLMDYYNHDLHDQRIIDTIAAYKKSEPNDLVNEMHSIFGSEVANLPSGLQQYYQRYFTNRAQVVAFANQYQAEFTSRQTAVAQADATLGVLKQQIDDLEDSLKSQVATIDARRNTLNGIKYGGDIYAYNAGIAGYNAQVSDYNADVLKLRGLIAEYNDLVNSRNATALEANQLSKELSNDTTTIN